jgi:hypothetical protein
VAKKNKEKRTTKKKKEKEKKGKSKKNNPIPKIKIKAEKYLNELNKIDRKLTISILGHDDIEAGEIIKASEYYFGKEKIFEVTNITKNFINKEITISDLELREVIDESETTENN